MIQILLLVFHLVEAFGTAKGFVDLITSKTIVSVSISRNFCAHVNFDKVVWLHFLEKISAFFGKNQVEKR